ncbi:MAG: hypothetical protein Q7S16_01445 [bacterium]|nr:hypothetical protein [bacterium]
MKKILLIILFSAVLVGGSFFAHQTVFAQAIGGKIMSFNVPCPGTNCGLHTIIGIRPSFPPGVICPMCMAIAGIGRWFLGFSVGGVVISGGLGGF